MYHERQQGGLCRMHALNMVLGSRAFDATQFSRLLQEFRDRFPFLGDPAQFDAICSTQEHVMAYALRARHSLWTCYAAPHYHLATRQLFGVDGLDDLVDGARPAFLVLKPDHVYAVRRNAAGQWFRLDSMNSGPIPVSLSAELACRHHGFAFAWTAARATKALPALQRAVACALLPYIPQGRQRCVREIDLLACVADAINARRFVEGFELAMVLFYRYARAGWSGATGQDAARHFDAWFDRFCFQPGDRVNTITRVPALLFWLLRVDLRATQPWSEPFPSARSATVSSAGGVVVV